MCVTGFLLDKKIGVNQPKRIENAKILIANTGMDTDKIKVCEVNMSLRSWSLSLSELNRWPHPSADLRLQGARGLHGKGGRDRNGREREDEGEGGEDPQTRHQLLHQQVSDTHHHHHRVLPSAGDVRFNVCVLLRFIIRQLIYNYPEQLFGAAGVMAIEHADFVGVERLALVTGMTSLTQHHTNNTLKIYLK